MTEHELTDEKIEELWGASLRLLSWRALSGYDQEGWMTYTRAAYDLGKQAAQDDGFIPCTFEDIQKGDTVERTLTHSDGSAGTFTGVAESRVDNAWYTQTGRLLASDDYACTYRRKPAPITHPDPEKHPIILDGDGRAWAVTLVGSGRVYQRLPGFEFSLLPEDFGNDWSPAKIVPEEGS